MLFAWLSQMGPLGASEADPWSFGWESLVALATLHLASVTGWLALTTRRLARSTAEEVQGQIRPVVVPAADTVVSESSERYPGDEYMQVRIRLRNIGAGPALNFNMTIGPMSSNDALPALGAGSERDGIIRVPRRGENEGVMGWSTLRGSVMIEYFDLGGRRYITNVGLDILNNEGETQISRYLSLTAGEVPSDFIVGVPPMENPALKVRDRTPGIRDLRHAWRYSVLQDADAPPKPLWPRLKKAWRWMYPKHRRTRYQRLVHARRAYKYTLDKPVRRWARGPLRRPYVIARGWKWGYLVYRNLR